MKTYQVWSEVNGRNYGPYERRAKTAENALRAQARIDRRKVQEIDTTTYPGTVYAICDSGIVLKTDVSDAQG